MTTSTTETQRPGEIARSNVIIFKEVGPRGGSLRNFKSYVAIPEGTALPHTRRDGNCWKPCDLGPRYAYG